MSIRPILIATHSNNPVSNAIVQLLKKRNHATYVVYTDAICQSATNFLFTFNNGQALLTYNDWQLNLSELGSAWYWRAIVKAQQHAPDIEREMQKTLWGTWETIDESKWLNHPYHIKRTQNKLTQLRHAHEAGLTTIPSLATNCTDNLTKYLPNTFVVKMPGKGLLHRGGNLHALYTTPLSKDATTKLANPFPGMYQPFLAKKKEWRVTIIGDKVFSAAIYTGEKAKDDWRLHSHDKNAVQFIAETFPTETAQKCKKLLALLGLRYGAFDFIETKDGDLCFVEVNSNGQFLWLEQNLGFPISEAIADELIAIANN